MAVSDALLDVIKRHWQSSVDPSTLSLRSLGGGCINEVVLVRSPVFGEVVVKHRRAAPAGFFAAEAHGLESLAQAAAIDPESLRVPRPIGYNDEYLIIEHISRGKPGSEFPRRFGRALAIMHQTADKNRPYGGTDNFIGLSPQANGGPDSDLSWPDFFVKFRLEFQMALAKKTGRADTVLESAVSHVIAHIHRVLPECPPASPLHGDLWGGNYLVDTAGRAVLIDPAYYRGHGEADLAMTELFGGFPREFYEGYREVIPDDGNYGRRREVYNLYHLLNHLNLFGGGYRSSALAAAKATGL